MTVEACADLVRRGDPDRWAAVLAATAEARPLLLPIYAANLEIARAPFAATEPMIAEMRVQWWVDALTEIAGGGPVRAHEVTTPLAAVLDAPSADHMIRVAEARRRDCWNTAFEDQEALATYLGDTGGALMVATTIATGGGDHEAARRLGTASALANLLLARPDLAARGRDLTRDLDAQTLSDMARDHLARIKAGRVRGPAALSAYLARGILGRAARDASAIDEGRLAPSEIGRRGALLRAAFLGP